MQRKRKISADPELQPILENVKFSQAFQNILPKDYVRRQHSTRALPHNNTPPQLPNHTSDIEERLRFVNQAICWVQEELTDMKQKDSGDAVRQYNHLTATVSTLRKMNTSFRDQCKIIHETEGTKRDAHSFDNKANRTLVDNRLNAIDSVASVNISSDCGSCLSEQKYKLIGQIDIRESFS